MSSKLFKWQLICCHNYGVKHHKLSLNFGVLQSTASQVLQRQGFRGGLVFYLLRRRTKLANQAVEKDIVHASRKNKNLYVPDFPQDLALASGSAVPP